ncbi:hypothetical protein F5Y14DRAFT_454318 [Nemania sp. NC0429]|nr:hypothetical protein F5Y14DRAFT_454318 [Nemania sp. NC0429]
MNNDFDYGMDWTWRCECRVLGRDLTQGAGRVDGSGVMVIERARASSGVWQWALFVPSTMMAFNAAVAGVVVVVVALVVVVVVVVVVKFVSPSRHKTQVSLSRAVKCRTSGR